jgi:hypothetical protein
LATLLKRGAARRYRDVKPLLFKPDSTQRATEMQTEEMLHQIVYVSKPTRSMELSEVRELLIKADQQSFQGRYRDAPV